MYRTLKKICKYNNDKSLKYIICFYFILRIEYAGIVVLKKTP